MQTWESTLSAGCSRGPVSRGTIPAATNRREHSPKKCSVQCSSETDGQAPLTSENPCGKWQGTNTSGLTRIASPVPPSDTRYLPPSASKPRMRQREFASSGRDWRPAMTTMSSGAWLESATWTTAAFEGEGEGVVRRGLRYREDCAFTTRPTGGTKTSAPGSSGFGAGCRNTSTGWRVDTTMATSSTTFFFLDLRLRRRAPAAQGTASSTPREASPPGRAGDECVGAGAAVLGSDEASTTAVRASSSADRRTRSS